MFPNCSADFFGYEVRVLPPQIPPLQWLNDLVSSLFINLTPVYLLLATIGNALSIVVFRRPAMSFMSNGFILIAITDLLVLFICMLELYLHYKGYMDVCKILILYLFFWIRKSFLTFGHWLLILVSIEETVVIFRLKKGRKVPKISGGKICCLYISLLAFTFFINLPYFFQILLLDRILIAFYSFMNTFDGIITGAVPFVIMLGLDIAILGKICAKGKRELKMCKRGEESQKGEITLSADDGETREENYGELDKTEKENKEGTVQIAKRSRAFEGAILIMALNAAAILFDMPNSVVFFLGIVNFDIIHVTVFLIFTRHAFNFLLYFFSFHFRQEFFRLFSRCRRHPSVRGSSFRVTPLQTVTGGLGV